MKWRELEWEQKPGLDYKISKACEWIAKAFNQSTHPALAFSGGKDSTALLHLIRSRFPDQARTMPVILGNTGVEYPESLAFARQLATDWQLDFHETRPGKTDKPGYKYAGQRRIWERLIQERSIWQVLQPDGKLKSTDALEKACPADLRDELVKDRLVWPAGSLMSYWWCADQYGWPLMGKDWSKLEARRINIDTFLHFSKSESDNPQLLAYYAVLRQSKISQHCCQVLKKDPSEKVQAELGVDLIFKGLMASESRTRAINFMTRGYLFEGAKQGYLHGSPFFHCQPLAIWTDADIWDYIHRFQVPYSSLYDLTFHTQDGGCEHIKRNGCLGCGTDFGFRNSHMFVLRQTHRRAWQTFMRAGMGEEIRQLQRAMRFGQLSMFDTTDTNDLIDMQPCVFDDMDGLGGMEQLSDLVYDPDVD